MREAEFRREEEERNRMATLEGNRKIEEERVRMEEEQFKLKVEADRKKGEEEDKLKQEEAVRWAEERRRQEFRMRTESRHLEGLGDLSQLVNFLKKETELLQAELAEKDKKIEQLIQEQTNQKNQYQEELNNHMQMYSKLKGDHIQQKRKLAEQHLIIQKCKKAMDNHKTIMNRMVNEKKESDEEIQCLQRILKEKEETIRRQEDHISDLKVTLASEFHTSRTSSAREDGSVEGDEGGGRETVTEEEEDYLEGMTFQMGDYFKGYEEFENQQHNSIEAESSDDFDFGGGTLNIGSYFVEEHDENDE